MPNRIIKESINESMGLGDCSIFTQDLYKRLITYADDYGRFNGDPEIMRARLYPRALDDVSEGDLVDSLTELVGVGKIAFYIPKIDSREYNKKLFGCFPKWEEHQRVRNTRAKYPDPEKEINDWYLRRFIPIKLKIKIFERDGFICQECGKDYSLKDVPTRRAMRLIGGALHIDHIVPVAQGGRATEENLRLLCESCNLSQQRYFTIDEIVQFSLTCRNSPRPAATRRDLRPESNPIQSKSNLESESNPPKPFETTSQEYLFAEKLKSLILKNNPKARTPDDLQKWAADFDKILRIDSRPPKDVAMVIEYSQYSDFWMTNVLSPGKLRDKFDTLYLQAKKQGGENDGSNRRHHSGGDPAGKYRKYVKS